MKKEPRQQNDHELLLLSLQDPKVFGQIVDRYQEPFISKAINIIGNEEDAQDIVQETFTKIYLYANKFERRAGAGFNSWAYKILLNTCFTYYKKHKRSRGDVSLDESVVTIQDEIAEESNLERFMLVISKIPEGAARLLRSLVIEGKSYEDISKAEGVDENTLRVRVHRAKETFKKTLIQNPNL